MNNTDIKKGNRQPINTFHTSSCMLQWMMYFAIQSYTREM